MKASSSVLVLFVSTLAAVSPSRSLAATAGLVQSQSKVIANEPAEREANCQFQLPPAHYLGDTGIGVQAGAWSLPIEDALGTVCGTTGAKVKACRRLDASIDLSDSDNPIGVHIEQLMDQARWQKDESSKQLDKVVAHYRTATQRAIAQTKDTADYIVPFRGFGPSSEAGDIILGEKLKLKTLAAAEYARQKHADALHLSVATDVMQIAMGLGAAAKSEEGVCAGGKDGGAAAIITSGTASLDALVGKEQTQKTLALLSMWAREVDVPDAVFKQPVWDIAAKQAKVETILANAVQCDPVIDEITKRVHKYNQRSKLARASAHGIQSILGVASLTPDFVGPAAKAALVTYVTATGGPEQCKLLKELYLDKRFESRLKVLNEQAHLAVDNYQVALLTGNSVLLIAAESLVGQMAGDATVKSVFGQSLAR